MDCPAAALEPTRHQSAGRSAPQERSLSPLHRDGVPGVPGGLHDHVPDVLEGAQVVVHSLSAVQHHRPGPQLLGELARHLARGLRVPCRVVDIHDARRGWHGPLSRIGVDKGGVADAKGLAGAPAEVHEALEELHAHGGHAVGEGDEEGLEADAAAQHHRLAARPLRLEERLAHRLEGKGAEEGPRPDAAPGERRHGRGVGVPLREGRDHRGHLLRPLAPERRGV
mmetsp:Transcript_12955/g.43915  ORF Transcript_12955/g.43915 Transcript_12955/m.43915 type:complete len:225 (+) Transcript_12955:245-919(+)